MLRIAQGDFESAQALQETGKKAGAIQCFETCYEVCWKYMKRWLEQNADTIKVDGLTRFELFRLAAEYGLVEDVKDSFETHKCRSLTSHTYNAEMADEAFVLACQFLPLAVDFSQRINAKKIFSS